MRVAFVGKGGSGKTTLASLFARAVAASGATVVAIDADINQHLGVALGLTEHEAAAVPAMGAHLDDIEDHLRGSNPRIGSAAEMVKTTPAGAGSRLLRPGGDDPLHGGLSRYVDGVRLLACFGQSGFVRNQEQGGPRPLGELEDSNRAGLGLLRSALDACPQDWARRQRQAAEFHLKNAAAWGHRSGVDLAAQIDTDFVPGLTAQPAVAASH